MIIGIGCDIVNTSRIIKIIKSNHIFIERVLTQIEIHKMPQLEHKQIEYIASRWASKEAISKAFGCGIGASLSFQDISILNHQNGAPYVEYHKNNLSTPNYIGMTNQIITFISISCDEFAISNVIIEKR